ncbi:MAG TPA: hypothetical protein VF589_03110 [Allosphingosinicella sp.]
MLFYFFCLFAIVAYALWRGGKWEKLGALTLLAGSILTLIAVSAASRRFADVETGILLVDAAVLAAFLAIALRSDRYWPLWTAALQLIGLLGHFAKLADLEMPRNGYGFLQAFWSYPMMLTILIGTWNQHRAQHRGQQRAKHWGSRAAGPTSPRSWRGWARRGRRPPPER